MIHVLAGREQELVREVHVMTKIKETVDTLRNEVKVLKRELAQKNVDTEAVGEVILCINSF